MKRLISVLLAVMMVLSSVTAFAFSVDAEEKDIPIVCVHGYGANYLFF